MRLNTLIATSLALLTLSLNSQATEQTGPTINFNEQGFTLSAPADATQLQLRLVNPKRQLIVDERTTNTSLDWQLTGYEADGNYRYEAIIVTDHDGTAQQHNLAGGFDIHQGSLIVPIIPTKHPDLEEAYSANQN